ncbi:uncharacterized protein LOC143083733 [Mytilus galloprovincialis]|uniref:uncharacterized protein LOC143083733 n=1 Tax=Mytilus galloprovincialis TaxID=29158 RepID=UPI003F7BC44B
MAVSTLRLTVEEKNYWKFCMLNVRVVPDALRNYFDGLIPPTSLATTINQNSSTISYLVTRKVINAAQLNILQRIPGTIWPLKSTRVLIGTTATSSADFDVSLLVCLLRNIPLPGIYPPTSGWDNLPNPHDISPGAHLARIKYYRNELAHATENNLNILDFQDRWATVTEAIKFCNGGHNPNGITDILHGDLDGSQNGVIVASLSTQIEAIRRDLTLVEGEKIKMENELKRTEFQLENMCSDFHFYKDGHIAKNISDNIQDLTNKWKKDDQPFFVTRAAKHVFDKLETVNIVVIIGQSGSGKSATARNVALKWESQGYDVVPVESVEKNYRI